MAKKKILFLSPLPPPYYGSAMSSKECLEILKKDENFRVKNIKINFAPDLEDVGQFSFKKLKQVLIKRKEIENKIREFNPDLIYVMPATSQIGLFKDFLFILKIKKYFKNKNKILYHIRTRITEKDKKNPVKKNLYKKIFENSRVIVLDYNLKRDVGDFVNDKDIFVLPNAIKNEISEKDLRRILKKREKEKTFNILFLSNLHVSKGWYKLLKACTILKNKRINFVCNFAGAWPSDKEKKEFYSYVKKNKLKDNVNYLGVKTSSEKKQVFEKSHVLVFPTEYKLETFGRVIIEAMMYSMPVIANGIASIPNTIQHNKTGFILKNNTPKEIADYLEKLYKNKKLREKMGKLGRGRFLQEYEMKKYAEKFKKIILKML